MDFISLFQSRHSNFTSSEAIKKYVDFCIENSTSRIVKLTERHHILPKSMFPEFRTSEENIVNLSLSNHIIAHVLLMEAIPCSSYVLSVKRSLGNIPRSKDEKEKLIEAATIAKERWRRIAVDDNPNLGKKRSTATRELMSRSQKKARLDNPDSYALRIWITNGDDSQFIKLDEPIPEGWYRGRPEDVMNFVRRNAIGRIQPEEEKRLRSESLKTYYELNPHHMQDESVRKKRSDAWSKSNPSQTEEFKANASIRSKERWSDPEYRDLMKKTGMKNKGKIQFCNLETRELSRFIPGTEPVGWIKAKGLVERSEGKLKIKDGIH